jgi:hypothetical protein
MAKNVLIAVMGVISLLYIINPTAGVFEILPDNLPFIGNIDEATATALLIACLRYYGWDITKFLPANKAEKDKKE